MIEYNREGRTVSAQVSKVDADYIDYTANTANITFTDRGGRYVLPLADGNLSVLDSQGSTYILPVTSGIIPPVMIFGLNTASDAINVTLFTF